MLIGALEACEDPHLGDQLPLVLGLALLLVLHRLVVHLPDRWVRVRVRVGVRVRVRVGVWVGVRVRVRVRVRFRFRVRVRVKAGLRGRTGLGTRFA